jgi:hypothetical protein
MKEFLLRLCIGFPHDSAQWCRKSFHAFLIRQKASRRPRPCRLRRAPLPRKVSLVAMLYACIVPGLVAAQCPAGEVLVAEDENNWYCRAAGSYRGSRGEQLAGDYCKAKSLVAADQNAIRQLGFSAVSERFEMFQQVAEDQRAELKNKVIGALFDQGLDATDKLFEKSKSLNPWNVNNALSMLEKKHFGNAQVMAALRRIAAARGKPEMAASYHEFAEAAKHAAESYRTAEGVAKEPGTAQLQLLLGALKTLQGNYEAGLVVTALEFGESMAYLGYVTGQVNSLAAETDEELMKLNDISARLRARVSRLSAAKLAWQKEMDIPVAPRCDR